MYKKIYYQFFLYALKINYHMSSFFIFSSELSSSEFFSSESEELSILSIIYFDIYFSLTIYLHSSKST